MDKKISEVTEALQEGKVVSFPTETVYALSVDPFNEEAVNALYQMKDRDRRLPLAFIVKDQEMLETLVSFPEPAKKLFKKCCPGPLTLVLPKKKKSLLKHVNPGFDTIAVRCPDHPTTQAILSAWEKPLIATSANLSGEDPLLSKKAVKDQFGDSLAVILDGKCQEGIASTIVDLTEKTPKILRVGSIAPETIKDILDTPIFIEEDL